MECRKAKLERRYSKEFVALFGAWIPCPVCGVIHTPEGDRQITIQKEDKHETISAEVV